MKALVWTKPREFEIQNIEKPSASSDEVIIRVHYSGICGSELSGYLGENSLRKPPLIMGHEFSGEVVQRGGNVNQVQVGEKVVVNPLVSCGVCGVCKKGFPQYCKEKYIIGVHRPGSFAEYVKVPGTSCFPISEVLEGVLVEPLACAVRAARQANIQLGDNVVVFGAGIIGLFSLKIAQLLGANKRILVDTNNHRLEFGAEFGATHTINPQDEDVVNTISKYTNGSTQKVIDAVGLPVTRQQGVDVLVCGGRLVFVGLHKDETLLPGNVIVRNEIEIVGSFSYAYDDFYQALSLIKQKIILPNPTWLDVRSIDEGKKAFDEQIVGAARFPKIVLSCIE